MIHGQCRSHYVSHFAAFFIVARAKISVVESCLSLRVGRPGRLHKFFRFIGLGVEKGADPFVPSEEETADLPNRPKPTRHRVKAGCPAITEADIRVHVCGC